MKLSYAYAIFPVSLTLLLGACDSGGDGQFEGEPHARAAAVDVAPFRSDDVDPSQETVTGTEATAEVPAEVVSTVIGKDGDEIGSVIIHPHRQGVRVDLHVEGLQPGTHAVHFHEVGECQPPAFESAGAHYDPAGGRHGMPDADEDMNDPDHHAGDMLNQTVNDIGQMDVQITNQSVSVNDGPNPLLDEDGSALVIHALADDFESQPAGSAGERVACAELAAIN